MTDLMVGERLNDTTINTIIAVLCALYPNEHRCAFVDSLCLSSHLSEARAARIMNVCFYYCIPLLTEPIFLYAENRHGHYR
jgi:hypothetical protein